MSIKETNMWKLASRICVGFMGPLAALGTAAECSVDACSDVLVDQIYVETGANSWIRTSGTETNLNMCTPDSGVYLWLDGSLAQKKEVLSLLMLVYSLDKPVYIRVTNGARGCAIAYVFLNR
jgi:hypothetical protein